MAITERRKGGRHAARRTAHGRRSLLIVAIVVLVAGAGLGAVLFMRQSGGGGSSPTVNGGANDAAASSDLRNAVAVLEQCFADNTKYPASIDSTGGAIADCPTQHLSLSSGSAVSYFTAPSGDGYILSVVNSAGGAAGKAYCYSSQGGQVAAITQPLTGWRASC